MTKYTDLYPPPIVLIRRKWFKEEGNSNYYVPNDTRITHIIAVALGSGGMGDAWGGAGLLVKEKAEVTPGELLQIQVGKLSTGSVLGDSYVKRANNNVIVYADRGRGNGVGGLAANSTGSLKIPGNAASASGALAGAPASDLTYLKSLGFGGFGAYYSQNSLMQAADDGGAGRLLPIYNSDGSLSGSYVSDGAGPGKVCLEFYNGDPGAINL